MRNIRFFLLMLFFALQTALAGAEPVQLCCDEACAPAVCATMGCATSVQPALAGTSLLLPAPAAVEDFPELPAIDLPLPLKEVWTPPD
jgi:hypothetical protein